MAYFPNGTSGDVYQERWCYRCVNWVEDPDDEGNWGCIVLDLHMAWNYEQCRKTPRARIMKQALEHFIPSKDGDPQKCNMFIVRATADVPGQYKMEF